jgi:recombination protein RecR
VASLPEPIVALTAALSKLPGIGPRSAERIAMHLVQSNPETVQHIADSMLDARRKVSHCTVCGGLTEKQPCVYCDDPRRDHSVVCMVERPVDILSIEKSGAFKGTYHVLGGKISPLNGVDPEDLRIHQLEQRLGPEQVQEIILALSSDVEGDATSHYLQKLFTSKGVRVSRLAQGLPAGSGLEFADELTLQRALQGRREIQ